MEPFTILPLVTCLLAAAAGAAVLARGPGERINQLTTLMLAAGAHWALCEVIWNNLDDPLWVARTIRISGFGWMPLGPLLLHLVLEAQDDTRSRLRRSLRWFYAAAAVSQLVYLASPLGLASVSATPWGWSYTPGPFFPLIAAPTVGGAMAGIFRWWRELPRAETPLERRQARQALAAMGLTLVVALGTDVIVPSLGIALPRLGCVSVIVFCAVVAYGVTRHDYFVLAPGTLARRIMESLREGAALLSRDGRIGVANDAFARLLRLNPAIVVGARLDQYLPDLPSLDARDLDVFETDLQTAAGTRTPVAISSAALHDKAGRIVGWAISVRDLRDVAAIRDRVLTAGRLAAVGELAAGVVHEISNPVSWMRSNLSSLRGVWVEAAKRLERTAAATELAPVLAEGEDLIDESIEGVERIARLVASVRSFSHAGQGERELADVNVLVDAALTMAEPKLRQREATVQSRPGELPLLHCAPQELKQLFLNLLINSANAVERGGRIRVSTHAEADCVVVGVEDDGCGMTPQQVRGIFDPVFRSRARGGGFAIGLPACHEIVRKHGGEIEVESQVGQGTAFRISLPISPA